MNWIDFGQDILMPGISVLEKIVRPMVVYIFLLIGLRLAGRRELAQLNSFDFVVLLMLSNTVQNAIIGNDNSVTGGIIGASTLLITNTLVVRFLYKHPKWSRMLEGQAVYLVQDGKLNERELEKQTISKEELSEIVRRQGLDSLAQVQDCILETNGTVTVVAKKEHTEEARQEARLTRLDQMQTQLELLIGQQQKLLAHLEQSK